MIIKLLPIFLILISACAGSGENDLTDLDVSPDEVVVNERAKVEVQFDTERDLDLSANDIDLVVFLPDSLQFDEDSSSFLDDDDDFHRRLPNRIENCPKGSFLVYRFNDNELDDHSYQGEFGITFDIIALSKDDAVIKASAGENQKFSCSDFDSEEEVVLVIE